MALQTSGAISLNQIHVEAGGASGTQASLNDSDIRDMIGKASGAQSSFNEFYGASSSIFTWDGTNTKGVGTGYYVDYGIGYGSGGGNKNTWYTYASETAGNGVSGGGSAYGWVQAPSSITIPGGITVDVEYDITLDRNGPLAQAFICFSTQHKGNNNGTQWNITGRQILLGASGSPYGSSKVAREGYNTVNLGGSTSEFRHSATARFDLGGTSSSTYYIGVATRTTSNPNGNGGTADSTLHSLVIKEV